MIGLALASLVLGVPEPAVPTPTPALELSWSAPAECPSADDLRAAVVALIGRPLASDPERVVHVDGVITRASSEYVLELHIRGESGTIDRRFTASDCNAVVEPAVVVAALAVDPATVPPPSVPPPMQASPQVVARPDEVSPARPVIARDPGPRAAGERRRRRVQLVLGVRGGVDGGNLPGARGTLEAAVGVRLRSARIELGAIHLFARTLPTRTQPGGSFRTTAARGQGCWEPRIATLSLPTCGGIELGRISASGVNVMQSSTVHHLWLALFAGTGLMWAPVPRFALGVRGDLVVGPLRRGFTLAEQPLMTTAVVGGRGSLALELRLP